VTFAAALPVELVVASRLFGAGVFLLAVYGKLRNWVPFIGVVANYRLLPDGTERMAAVMIVAAELVVAASLATGLAMPYGGVLGIVLLLGFAAAMAIAMARGQRTIDCGCFQSSLRQTLTGTLVVRNLVLAGLLLPALAAVDLPGRPLQLIDGVAAGMVLLILNAAIAVMISIRDANAGLRKRLA
jgi:hypothetical protein